MKLLLTLMISIFSLRASEIGLLLEVKNNSLLYFSVQNREELCVPYGIVTFEMLMFKSRDNELCQKALFEFYDKNPLYKSFAKKHFYPQQQYIFERKKSSCIIHASGKKNYSAMLLENGLAIVKKSFKDRILEPKYRRIENGARFKKVGLWSDRVLRNCITQIEL